MLDQQIAHAIVTGLHSSPFDVLGPHEAGPERLGLVIRTLQPFAATVEVVEDSTGLTQPMERIHEDGVFELFLPGRSRFPYRLRMTGHDRHVWELEDPYRFPLVITEFDQYLFGEGTHYRTYEKMGAQAMTLEGVPGVHFAVWAPNAARVSVVGDFNRWDGRHHPLQSRGGSGLWELFVPRLQVGDLYKYEVRGRNGQLAYKADPYAFAAEVRPSTASRVWDVRRYVWNDDAWMAGRPQTNWLEQPISVYEVHLGSWRRDAAGGDRWLTYRELADQLVPYIQELGFTHIELMPICEHPFDGSWGYQTIGYFAPTSRFGTPDDFAALVDRCHQAGIGVILDWVPAHFPKDDHGLAYFDGTHLYEHSDPRKGEHSDWGTLIFNYGRNEVRAFLLSNAIYWADVFHIDGLRVDAVASMIYLDYSRKEGEWIPNEFGGRENLEAVDFLKKFNEIVHAEYPGFLTFAEESTAWPMVSRPTYLGGLGFDFKWNMGWMHDTLEYFSKDPVFRQYHHNHITFSLLYAFTENFILPFSHDEVTHGKGSMLGKMPGDQWQRFANLRLLYALMFAHPGKKLLFMGSEIGQGTEWDHDGSVAWDLLQYPLHAKIQKLVGELNRLHRSLPALHELDFCWEGFQWIDFHDTQQSVVSFVRRAKNPAEQLVCVFNFTPAPRDGYRIGVPGPELLQVVLNTDAAVFGGSDLGHVGLLKPEPTPWQGQPCSVALPLPPLAALYLRPVPDA
ncbi:MAG: 1,4-alpha-glucan branching protein GlgB [Planctomycetota bacterium]|nr:1,4-alpha-glucan branching protein GlgB [Planctomycetota bacterium]